MTQRFSDARRCCSLPETRGIQPFQIRAVVSYLAQRQLTHIFECEEQNINREAIKAHMNNRWNKDWETEKQRESVQVKGFE